VVSNSLLDVLIGDVSPRCQEDGDEFNLRWGPFQLARCDEVVHRESEDV